MTNFIYLSYVLFAVICEVVSLILTIRKHGKTTRFIGNLLVGGILGVILLFITPITVSSIRGNFPYPQITVGAISIFLALFPFTVINAISLVRKKEL